MTSLSSEAKQKIPETKQIFYIDCTDDGKGHPYNCLSNVIKYFRQVTEKPAFYSIKN